MHLGTADEREIKKIVLKTRSVRAAAEILGVRRVALSQYLNTKKRQPWWQKVKARWSNERSRERQRRWRTSKAPKGSSGRRSPLSTERDGLVSLEKIPEKNIRAVLVECRSVSAAAEILGVPVSNLSRYLNVAKRKSWWQPMKTEWSKERKRAREARDTAKRAQRRRLRGR